MGSIGSKWTEKEIGLLKKYYTLGPDYCSKMIGRTRRACQERCKVLKLKRTASFKYEDVEKFKEIVNGSKSYKECVIKFGLSPRGSGNYQTIKKYIRKYEIDISHFENSGGFKNGNIPSNKVNLEDILHKDSYISRVSLKKKLYAGCLKERKCEICGQCEDWFGLKLVHILDHINGDPYDNRLENLRIVCPNCNSTLETHCVGNRIKKIYDADKDIYVSENTHKKCRCGKPILKNSKFCNSCKGESQRKIERPDYNTILKDIKELGYVGAGKKYGISDNGDRKSVV